MSQLLIRSTLSRFWCGVLVATCLGCQTYSPYGYNGYSGGYPMYNQPGVMPYGSTGVQPGTTIVPAQPYPGATIQSNPYGQGYNNVNPYSGSLPQGADSSGDSLGQPGNFPGASSPPRPNVPSDRPGLPPDDPEYFNGPNGPAASAPAPVRRPNGRLPGGPADFQGDTGGPDKAKEKLKKMETSQPGVPDAALFQNNNTVDQFATTADGTAFSDQSGVIQTTQHVEAATGTRELRPYGKAPNGRAWFRGMVDFDEQEKAWYLIYNPEPDMSDKHGGIITLVDHPELKRFQPDDVILVEGQFDPSETDRYGNAKYRSEIIRKLVP